MRHLTIASAAFIGIVAWGILFIGIRYWQAYKRRKALEKRMTRKVQDHDPSFGT